MKLADIFSIATSGNVTALAPVLEKGLGTILDKLSGNDTGKLPENDTENVSENDTGFKSMGTVMITRHPKTGQVTYTVLEIAGYDKEAGELRVSPQGTYTTKTLLEKIK